MACDATTSKSSINHFKSKYMITNIDEVDEKELEEQDKANENDN